MHQTKNKDSEDQQKGTVKLNCLIMTEKKRFMTVFILFSYLIAHLIMLLLDVLS